MMHTAESEQHKQLRLAFDSSGGQSGGVKFGLSEREIAVLGAVEADPYLSAEDIAERIAVSKRSVERTIKALRDKGMVSYVGPSKGGYWSLQDENVVHDDDIQ